MIICLLQVPPGVWSIYNTRKICCGVHSPYSTVCNQKGPNGPADFDLSTVPERKEVALKFQLTGLPDDIDKSKLEENILNSLKIILSQLKDREPDLQVTDIVERACTGRKLDGQKRLRFTGRELRDASVCYTVEVMNNDNKKDYEGLIVKEAIASIDIILNQVRTKFNAVNVNLGMAEIGNQNVSGNPNGGGSNSNGGGNSNVGSSSNGGSNTLGNGMKDGLPWWAVLLIVLLVLVLTCWIGFCIYAAVRDSRDDKDVNILFNNYPIGHTANKRGGNTPPSSLHSSVPTRRRRKSFAERGSQAFRRSFARGSGRPRNARDRPRRRDDGRKRNSHRDRFDRFRSSFTNVAGRPRRYRENSRDNGNPTVSFNNIWDRKPTDELSIISLQNNAQDPPMNAMVLYEPDKTKPDPDGVSAGVVVLALTNGGDPDTRPKLEPEETHNEALSVSPALPDPSVARSVHDFVEQQQVLYGARDDDDEEYDDDEEEEYDQYGFRRSQPDIVVPQRENKKGEWEESLSFVTSDPGEIKKRLKKKKKKKRRQHSSSDESRRRDNDSNSTRSEIDRSDGNRSYRKKRSGVESIATDDESFELYSRASA